MRVNISLGVRCTLLKRQIIFALVAMSLRPVISLEYEMHPIRPKIPQDAPQRVHEPDDTTVLCNHNVGWISCVVHGNACDGMCEDEDEDDDDDKDDTDCDKVNSYDRIGKDSRPREARPKNLVISDISIKIEYIYIYIL